MKKMNNNTSFNVFLLCIFSFLIIQTIQWRISFIQEDTKYNPEKKYNEITIINGIFLPIKAIIKADQTNISTEVSSKTTLNLDDSSNTFFTSKKSYEINVKDSLSYVIEIGVSCDINVEKNEILTFVSSSEYFVVDSFKIQVKFRTFPELITFKLYGNNIPRNGYGIITVDSNNLKNVNQLEISFTKEEQSVAFIESLVIPQYNPENPKIVISSKFGVKDVEVAPSTQKFQINYNNKCFKGKSEISFEVSTTETIPSPSNAINSIMKSANLFDKGKQSSVTVRFNIDIAPLVTTCVLQEISSNFITDDEVVSMSNPNYKYFYQYIESTGIHSVSFSQVSQYQNYKMKCVFESASYTNKESITLTFGYFEESDIKIELNSDDVAPLPIYCLTWVFAKTIDPQTLYDKTLDYCYNYFLDDEIPREKNGCIECISRNVEGVYSISGTETLASMCIKSKDVCESSTYNGDLARKFEDLVRDLQTGETLHSLFDLDKDQYEVSKIYIESDIIPPSEELISIQPDSFLIDEKEVSFFILSEEFEKKIECSALVQQRSTIGIPLAEYKKKFILENEKKYSVPFDTTGYDGLLYNLIFMCYFVPNLPFHFRRSEPFVIGQFERKENAKLINEPVLALKCDDILNKYREDCFVIHQHSFLDLQTNINLLQYKNTFKEFRQLGPSKQFEYLEKQIGELLNLDVFSDVLSKVILINDLVYLTRCRNFINFHACRIKKKELQTKIITKLNSYFGNENFVSLIEDKDESRKEEKLKKTMISFFYLSNNPDSFDYEATKNYISILNNISKSYTKLLNLFPNNVSLKKDLVKMLLGTLDNVIDIFSFVEIDNNFQINEKTGFIKNELSSNYVLTLENLPSLLLFVAIPNVSLNHYSFQINEINLQVNHNITILTNNNIIVGIPNDYLISTFKAKYVSILDYMNNYPLLSYVLKDGKPTPAISIKLFDEKFNEIKEVKGLPKEKKIKIYFSELDSTLIYCYYYDNGASNFAHSGVVTNQGQINEKKITCITEHLSDFLVGSENIGGEIYSEGLGNGLVIFFSVAGGLIGLGIIVMFVVGCVRRKKIIASKEIEYNKINDTKPIGI